LETHIVLQKVKRQLPDAIVLPKKRTAQLDTDIIDLQRSHELIQGFLSQLGQL
jgi:hypothetical protein